MGGYDVTSFMRTVRMRKLTCGIVFCYFLLVSNTFPPFIRYTTYLFIDLTVYQRLVVTNITIQTL